jgi:acyl-CoA synthetase (AMP-forming)/AMP-acid ligase II
MVVGDMLIGNAHKFPSKAAVVFRDQSITYGTLNERVNALSNELLRLGLKKGDRLGVLVHNGPRFVELYFTAAKTGAIFCPYNNHAKEAELRDLITYSSPRFLFFEEDFGGMVDGLRKDVGSVEHYINLQGKGVPFAGGYEEMIAAGDRREPGIPVHEDDVMSIFFTSGTTGKPKGAMRTHRHVMANVIAGLIEFKIGYNERILVVFPMYHVSYEDNIGRSFFLPNTMVIRREGGFDADEVLELIARERITFCHLVPTMVNSFLQSPNITAYDLSALRTIFYAGSPMPVSLLRKAMKVFNVGFFQGYGMTEAGPHVTLLRPADHVVEGSPADLERLGSVGTPVVGIEVKVVREDGGEASTGEVGEIVCRGEATIKSYWQLPDQSAEKVEGGWLHTGDVGRVNDDGYVYLVDRKHDMIITGGINVYPKEVEEVLYQHPSVLEAAVIGAPDEHWGEIVKAVVVRREGASVSEKELIKFCGDRLAGYKKPRSVEFWDELPKNQTGKIFKRAIKDVYWKASGRAI